MSLFNPSQTRPVSAPRQPRRIVGRQRGQRGTLQHRLTGGAFYSSQDKVGAFRTTRWTWKLGFPTYIWTFSEHCRCLAPLDDFCDHKNHNYRGSMWRKSYICPIIPAHSPALLNHNFLFIASNNELEPFWQRNERERKYLQWQKSSHVWVFSFALVTLTVKGLWAIPQPANRGANETTRD